MGAWLSIRHRPARARGDPDGGWLRWLTSSIPTPSQTVGPFFHIGLDRPDWADLTSGSPQGERIVIEGRVIDGDGASVPDACLELWQANAAGRYAHPDDTRTDKPLDPEFPRLWPGCDRCRRPVSLYDDPARAGARTRQRVAGAAHRRRIVRPRILKQLFTRIYFAGDPLNETDPVLLSIDDPGGRETLIATRRDAPGPPTYRFDLILQGERETAFFDL